MRPGQAKGPDVRPPQWSIPGLYDDIFLLGISRPGSNPPVLANYATPAGCPSAIQLNSFGKQLACLHASVDVAHMWKAVAKRSMFTGKHLLM